MSESQRQDNLGEGRRPAQPYGQQIDTGGGTSVGGDTAVGRDFVGRDQIIYGSTPEQVTEMFSRMFGLFLDIPRARNLLVGAHGMLDRARVQLGQLAEYKATHDLLQQLESSYQVLYSLIYDEGELLATTQVRWRSLKRSRVDLESTIERLCLYVVGVSFAADLEGSREALSRVVADMESAFVEQDLPLFDALLADVQHEIATQTPRINDRLIAVVDTLQMAELAKRLADMHHELMEASSELGEEQTETLAALSEDLDWFSELAVRLGELRDEHDHWQQADNELRAEQATLPMAGRRFAVRWERSLRKRLDGLFRDAFDADEQATLQASIAAVDAALAKSDLLDLIDAIDDCRRTILRRFNQIDHDLLTLCNLLGGVGGPIEQLLGRLA